MLVISDTSPLCYLLLIDQIDLLHRMYGQVIIPQAVRDELADMRSPDVVKNWIEHPPTWLEVQAINARPDAELEELDLGEREAILLMEQLGANLLMVDDRQARQVARLRNLRIIGLLGILEEAANLGLVDLPAAIARLQQTTFRAPARLIQSLLEQYGTDG